jgi:hypothetical protein
MEWFKFSAVIALLIGFWLPGFAEFGMMLGYAGSVLWSIACLIALCAISGSSEEK